MTLANVSNQAGLTGETGDTPAGTGTGTGLRARRGDRSVGTGLEVGAAPADWALEHLVHRASLWSRAWSR